MAIFEAVVPDSEVNDPAMTSDPSASLEFDQHNAVIRPPGLVLPRA